MALRYAYIASDNTASAATQLGTSGQDIYVKKVIFGLPANGEALKLYNKAVAFGHASGIASTDSANVAAYITQPATIGAGFNAVTEVDFTNGRDEGLRLDGGSVHTDASQVTVIFEPVDEAKQFMNYVRSDRYLKKKEEYEEYGIPTDNLIPVDLNAAYVPFKKDDPNNLQMTHECNLKRFGLESY